jgi:protoheme IX farnesyltransferase
MRGATAGRIADRLSAYFELTKPRIATLLLTVSVTTFLTASGRPLHLRGLLETILVVSSLAAGIFALNHYEERNIDGLMKRTSDRPLPSGRLAPGEALGFGLILTVFSILYAGLAVNLLTGLLCFLVAFSYLLVYTPLKSRTPYHTALGALPGAAPPLLGWAIAVGRLDVDAWILFGILFFWQFPHFLYIEMIYRDDYARAGIKVLPVVDKTGRMTALQIVSSLVLLLAVSLLPVITGLAGTIYLAGAIALGAVFLAVGILAVSTRKKIHARYLLRASVFYLPVLYALLMINP